MIRATVLNVDKSINLTKDGLESWIGSTGVAESALKNKEINLLALDPDEPVLVTFDDGTVETFYPSELEFQQSIKLTYFKKSGKYYTLGTFFTKKFYTYEILDQVYQRSCLGNMPGLIDGCNAEDFHILVEGEEPSTTMVPTFIPMQGKPNFSTEEKQLLITLLEHSRVYERYISLINKIKAY